MPASSSVQRKRRGLFGRVVTSVKRELRAPLNRALFESWCKDLHKEREHSVKYASKIKELRAEEYADAEIRNAKKNGRSVNTLEIDRRAYEHAVLEHSNLLRDIHQRLHEAQAEIDARAIERKIGLHGFERRVLAGPKANLRLMRMRDLKKAPKK